jgi:hypothetical protein
MKESNTIIISIMAIINNNNNENNENNVEYQWLMGVMTKQCQYQWLA